MIAAEDPISLGEAVGVMIGLAVILAVSGVVVVTIARRGADGRLGRNGLAGLRTKASRASDQAWLAAHQAALPDSVRAGWVLGLGGILSAVFGLAISVGDSDGHRAMIVWGISLGLISLLVTYFLIRSLVRGDDAARAVADDSSRC